VINEWILLVMLVSLCACSELDYVPNDMMSQGTLKFHCSFERCIPH
jgi:hypothetical protein